jgi:hypothetical protein
MVHDYSLGIVMKYPKPKNSFNPLLRKHLNADALFRALHTDFSKVSDFRQGDVKISMTDALMSGFAMFSLKDPSLLAFDERRGIDQNLTNIYLIDNAPCDTHMRTILDEVYPEQLREAFKQPIRQLQRGKVLERMVFFEGCYLLSLDGTGFFSSKKLHADFCLEKVNKKTGEVTYSLQMLGAAIVHPDFKEVIPLAPEFINKQDGQSKNDCERMLPSVFLQSLEKIILIYRL